MATKKQSTDQQAYEPGVTPGTTVTKEIGTPLPPSDNPYFQERLDHDTQKAVNEQALTNISRLTSTHPGPDADKLTPSEIKTITSKSESTPVAKDKTWQEDYQHQVAALLSPFSNAIGGLPAEFQSLISSITSNPVNTPTHADTLAISLAKKYSPAITASTSSLDPSLSSAEATAIATATKQVEPGGPVADALKSLTKLGKEYLDVAPYQQIVKALLGHVQYNTEYGENVLPASSNWPSWLKDLYKGSTGLTVGKNAASGLGSTGLSVSGLGTTGAASKGSTSTKTSPTAPISGAAPSGS